MAYQLNDFQEQWLKALESGEYKQAQNCLFDGSGYCCLGVACAVAGEKPEETSNGAFCFYGENALAPEVIAAALKLRTAWGDFESAKLEKYSNLTGANDGGIAFPVIAQFIRANPEQVFLP